MSYSKNLKKSNKALYHTAMERSGIAIGELDRWVTVMEKLDRE
jgi:hypothetical protein